ncbi:MAG: ATP-dependent RecD-like DNA helicase [Eubacteriales bacterium]|jgi:exodeoxyribonuclease V alpha subunit|nr:ATP-dependent RecD-like DNA helicase [Eubacteriales bacterium]MDD3572667.1 ATP-dependent RecD-like DNA helicase [Eubacteriales bacterium]MDD4133789.1 ATP-dependent RecD-like DNA helicase [Eubacteriales bacterium]
METLHGTVNGTLFRNEENGYSVISLRVDGDLQTAVGVLPELSDGEILHLEGEWMQHAQYGRQFKAMGFRVERPTTLDAIEHYLGSGLIRGVGPSTAKLIVEAFGQDTLEVLTAHPERLKDVPKIGKKRMAQIHESFLAQQQSRSTFLFLQRYGVTPALSNKINKLYREHAERFISENPYRLIDDIDGVGFLTADRIARSLGITQDSAFRLRAGIKHVLVEAAGSGGHTYLPEEELVSRASSLLQVGEDLLLPQLDMMYQNRAMQRLEAGGGPQVSLTSYVQAEQEIARRLMMLTENFQQMFQSQIDDRINAYEQREGIFFSPAQRMAIGMAVNSGLSVITGGPGTGKTTLINCLLHVLGGETKTLLAAPTGRAAKRMSEATGQEACTIHRLLQFGGEDGAFLMDEENQLPGDCVVVDEVSMVDVFLMRSLLRAIAPGTRLVLVGDADQLPSVGPGNVLADILSCPRIPQARLNEIFRQAEQSMIVLNAHRINRGEDPVSNSPGSDFFFENKPDAVAAANSVVLLCTTRLPRYLKETDSARALQVLSPTKKGVCGVSSLNQMLQKALNPPHPAKQEIQYGDVLLRQGDKVIQTKNNYQIAWTTPVGEKGMGVFNGDIGFVAAISQEDKSVTVQFDDLRQVEYEYPQLEEVELAYCLSVHKSQGSEFPAVVIPVIGGPRMLLTRNLLYTAVTRARRLVVLVGRPQVVSMMVTNNLEHRRYSLLNHWLQVEAGEGA